jgi:hypothetical protein
MPGFSARILCLAVSLLSTFGTSANADEFAGNLGIYYEKALLEIVWVTSSCEASGKPVFPGPGSTSLAARNLSRCPDEQNQATP